MKKLRSILLIIVTTACFTTIILNYYTIKILSATRAYVNGESEYSKGQKEASQFLISYISTENIGDYTSFLKAIDIPIGDRIARESLSSIPGNASLAKTGFLQAKNHPADIENMIWLFKSFKNISLFSEIVQIWKQADCIVNQLYQKGIAIHHNINFNTATPADKKEAIIEINDISARLTLMQQDFSNRLGIVSRTISSWVFLLNVIVTSLIICSIILFVWITMHNMQRAQNKIVEQNHSLHSLNLELDKVIFNVSHDLRSPLGALTGLISLIEEENDIEQIKIFTAMMQKSVDKQNGFITEILLSTKNKTGEVVHKECNLSDIIEDVLIQNNYSNNGKKLHFEREIYIEKIDCDAIKLKTVLNNLISNAIKYSDPTKADSWVKIKTFRLRSACIIEVEDNGIGIKSTDCEKIFDKYFTAKHDNDSNGIGLYLTKDAVEKMHGIINVSSDFMIGTKFTIEIPCFKGSAA